MIRGELKMVKLFIDPGHGGSDSGAVGNGLREKDLTLTLAKKVRDLLTNYENVQVRLSRDTDIFISLNGRADMANNWGADYFMSIHINASGGTGFETYIHTGASSASVRYQDIIHPAIVSSIDIRDRGQKSANYAVLRETTMPAILTENGFIDNASDASKLKSDAFLNKVAQGHVDGLVKAFGLKKKATTEPTPPKSVSRPTNPIATFQQWLNDTYRTGLAVDGLAGPKTRAAAVKGIQTELNKQYKAGLAVDGEWGPKTEAAFRSVDKGDRGNLVYIIQGLLYCVGYSPDGLDGIFGENTRAAVVAFQKDRRLTQDGIVGKNTMEKLVG